MMECKLCGTSDCPAKVELDDLDRQINMRFKAEAELAATAADRDEWKSKAKRYLHLLALVEDDISDAHTLGSVRAILGAEPAQDDGKPESGDLVISASSQAVQWNGLPDPWYWTSEDEIAMQDETIVVIRRAAEIKRKIEEAKE